MSDISITKEAAAQRQIDAAIRMFFLHREDLFASYTIAAAARSIVKDLAGGKDVGYLYETRRALDQQYRDAVAAAIRSAETGNELEEPFKATLAAVVGYIARGVEVKVDEISLDPDPGSPKIAAALAQRARDIENHKRTHEFRNRAANFLKHGNRDADKSLSDNELDLPWVIADAISLWTNLNLPFTVEMQVYGIWLRGVTAENPAEFVNTKSGPIHLFTFEQQLEFGRWALKDMYGRVGRSLERFRDDAPYKSVQAIPMRMFTALD